MDNKIGSMFEFVECFGREEFEEKNGEFDLTQTFEGLSLRDKQSLAIRDLFSTSEMENILVREL
jgi:hypothetical protein